MAKQSIKITMTVPRGGGRKGGRGGKGTRKG
jgi:hypothetical protein